MHPEPGKKLSLVAHEEMSAEAVFESLTVRQLPATLLGRLALRYDSATVVSFRCLASVGSQSLLGAALTLQEQASCAGHLAQAVRGEKASLAKGSLDSRSFHMVAELHGAATAKAMSRPHQKETGEVFEEAYGGLSEASEV